MLTAINPMLLQPGQLVDGWRIMELLGAGTYGAVYRVEKGGQSFALKLAMHRDSSGDAEQAARRLMRELGCLVHLDHPNIVATHAHGRWPDPRTGWHYVVLDLVEGSTLDAWVERMQPTAREVVRVFGKLAAAMAHMHERGVFHRDLKLANLMVRTVGGEPVILDFSAGDYTHAADLTDAPLPPGTRRYRSPEAARFLRKHGDRNDARYEFKVTDDVYALGVCLYDVLTAPRPTGDEPRVRVEGRVMPPSPRELNPRVPATLSDVALRFIARRPEQRPPTAEVMRRQLEVLPQEDAEWTLPLHHPSVKPQLAPATRTGEAVPRPAHRRGVAAGLGLAFISVVMAFAYVWLPPALPAPALQGDKRAPAFARDAGRLASAERAPSTAAPSMASSGGVPSPAPVTPDPGVALPPMTPVQKAPPAVKRAPMTDSPAHPPRRVQPPGAGVGGAEFLKKCAAASAALALQMGCPGAQVRPEPGACPSEALTAMFKVMHIRRGDSVQLMFDMRQPGYAGEPAVFADGPVRGTVVDGFPEIPEGTVLYGQLWTGEGLFVARYTEAQLPNGRTYPVCIARTSRGWVGSKPGAVIFGRSDPAYVVERWP